MQRFFLRIGPVVTTVSEGKFISRKLMMIQNSEKFEYGCQDTQELLVFYILYPKELTTDECLEVNRHLGKCPACRRNYLGMKYTCDTLHANREQLIASGIIKNHPDDSLKQKLTHEGIMERRFQDKLRRAGIRRKRRERKEKIARFKQLVKPISAIAACLVVGFGLFYAVSQFNKTQKDLSPIVSNQQQNSVTIELISGSTTKIIPAGQLITAANELKTLKINDNRQMVLNIGTELSIEPYNLGCVVKLDKGEIFTEVEHDGKPFMVETSHGRAVITGTTFNIKADGNKMDLAVIEGSVQFESEKDTVVVNGGYQSSIIAGTNPTKPVVCNVVDVSQWAKGQKTNEISQINQPDIYFTKILDSPVSFIPYRDLEKMNFNVWINHHRSWFEREYPWTKRLQNILSLDGIQVDTIDLLIESGDLWRFAWPEYSPQRILAEDRTIIQNVANQYDVEVEKLFSVKSLAQDERISNTEAFGRWLDTFGKGKSSLTIDSIHAAVFLVNTRSLVWFAIKNDKIQVKDKECVLNLLVEQVRIASHSLETLNQLLLADKNESACSVVQYEEFIKNLKSDLSSMMEIERELTEHEVSHK